MWRQINLELKCHHKVSGNWVVGRKNKTTTESLEKWRQCWETLFRPSEKWSGRFWERGKSVQTQFPWLLCYNTGCPTYFPPFSKGYNLANNWLRSKILACECDLWAAILFETKKFFWKSWNNCTVSKKCSKMALLVKSTTIKQNISDKHT